MSQPFVLVIDRLKIRHYHEYPSLREALKDASAMDDTGEGYLVEIRKVGKVFLDRAALLKQIR